MARTAWFQLGCLALLGAALTACHQPPPPPDPSAEQLPALPTRAQPRLPTIKLWLGAEEMTAEQARAEMEIRTGMMFRTNLPENEGMIFVLDGPQRTSFWMKNCPLPLSAAYMDADGRILELHEFQPQNTNGVESHATNVEFVLETSQGWFQRHHVPTGTLVTTERGPLKKVYLE